MNIEAVDLSDTQTVPLGAFQDGAGTVVSSTNNDIMQPVYGNHVMESFTMDGSIEREFNVSTITWSTADATNTVKASLAFPDLLFGEPYLAEKTDDFRYFEAGVELSIRVTANKFVYGKLMVFWQPMAIGSGFVTPGDIVYSSTNPHVLVSATSEDAVIFRTPFIHTKRFLDLATWQSQEMGLFTVMVLAPLTDIQGTVNTATVFITARFINAKLSMPYSGTIVSAARREMIRQIKARKLAIVSKGVVARKQGKTIYGANTDNVSVSSYDMDFHTESRSLKGAESRAKSSAGLLSSALEKLTVLGSSTAGVPLLSTYANAITSVSKPMTSLSKMMGLSKPMTQSVAQSTVIDFMYDTNYGKGLNGAMKMAMDPENAISTEPNLGGVSEDEMLLTHIVGTPTLITSLPFTSLTGTTALIAFADTSSYANFCDFVCESFYYYAGSYKVKIYITASLMHNVRLVFYLADTAYGTDWQQCYHRIVDVKGDCEVDFMVPYCGQNVMNSTNTETSGFSLVVQVLAWSVPEPSLTLPIYLTVYKAGGSDFRFGAQMDTQFVCTSRNIHDDFHCQSNPREDFNKDFEPFHPSFKGYSTRNLVMGEEFVTLREIIHRYFPYTTTPADGSIPIYQTSRRVSGNAYHGLEYWGSLFRFWRGSIRFKFVQRAGYHDGSVVVKIAGIPIYGLMQNVATSLEATSVIQGEVPYYANTFMCDTTLLPNDSITLNFDDQPRYYFKSAGDDFSFHFLCGVNKIGTISQFNGSTTGFLGYQDYLDAPV